MNQLPLIIDLIRLRFNKQSAHPVTANFYLITSLLLLFISSPAHAATCIDDLSVRTKQGKVELVWTHLPDTQNYSILRSISLSGPYNEIAQTESTYSAYLDTSIDNGVLYYYKIQHNSTSGQNCLSSSIGAIAPAGRLRMKYVPLIEGLAQNVADTQLTAASLSTGQVGQITSDSIIPDHIVSQDPPVNSTVPENYPVNYFLSTGNITLLSPEDDKTIRYNNVTLEVATGNFTQVNASNLSLTETYAISGVINEASTYLYRIPLVEGQNIIELRATNSVGETSTRQLTLTSENINLVPLGIKTSLDEGFGTITTDISAIKPFPDAEEYLLDNESDGIIDSTNTTGHFTVTYDSVGRYQPRITVRTIDNILYTNDSMLGSPVTVKSQPQITGFSSITDTIVDLEEYDGTIYALTWNKFYKISTRDESNIETIDVPGISGPQGLTVDLDGNVFIADTGNNRIVKLLQSTGYTPDTVISTDGSFGTPGTGNGQFDQPRDVSVYEVGDQQQIYVLDSGNNRVQKFDSHGVYITQFDGSTTPGGKLNNPLNMIGAPNLVITDVGNNSVRELGLAVDDTVYENNNLNIPYQFGKITGASKGYVLPDKTNKQLNILYLSGRSIKQVNVTSVPSVGMAYSDNNLILLADEAQGAPEKLSIELDPPGYTPTDLVNQFIQAFISADTETMLQLTANHSKYIDLLNQSRPRVLEAFNNRTGINEKINGSLAGVTVSFLLEGFDASLQFELFRYQDRWLIKGIY